MIHALKNLAHITLFSLLFIAFPKVSYCQYYLPYQNQTHNYYGAEFYPAINSGYRDHGLKSMLNVILKSAHYAQQGAPDIIGPQCPAQNNNCYGHRQISYYDSKIILMGQLHLAQYGKNFAIRGVYCNEYYGPEKFSGKRPPGPGQAPHHYIMNTEHTWPQSHFSPRYSDKLQQADLHHLFPTDSRMNAMRGNMAFGYVDVPRHDTCPQFKVGYVTSQGDDFAEPPNNHKGNVARALMYFSIRYEMSLTPYQEAVLKQWHQLDPVDAEENNRAQAIYNIQGVRNPFIDHPQLVQLICDF